MLKTRKIDAKTWRHQKRIITQKFAVGVVVKNLQILNFIFVNFWAPKLNHNKNENEEEGQKGNSKIEFNLNGKRWNV